MTEVHQLSQQIGGTRVAYIAHDFREPMVFGNVADNDNESDYEAYERVKLRTQRVNDFWSTAISIAFFMVAFAAAGVIYHG